MKTIEDKRADRRKSTGECFTPKPLANQLASKLEEYAPTFFSDPSKEVLDPSCGDGALLLPFLQRKLEQGLTPLQALNSIYGCDSQNDNIMECRKRLLKLIVQFCKSHKIKPDHQNQIEMIKTLDRNIVFTPVNTKTPGGSLDYLSLSKRLTFNKVVSDEQAEKELAKIKNEKLLDTVNI